MKELLSGAMIAMYGVAGLFFLRFWSRTKDAIFAFFAAAFWVLAVQHLALALTDDSDERATLFYVVRLVAFLLIAVGILNKNRSPRSRE